MEKLLETLRVKFPHLTFTSGKTFLWSPESGEIFYKSGAAGQKATWSLLHETGHALLNHRSYRGDFELLQMELDAWSRAKTVAATVGVTIDEGHIEDCLDTYRDWLYKRSICPECATKCLQQDDHTQYRCHNCHTPWKVTANRFGRAYRRQTAHH